MRTKLLSINEITEQVIGGAIAVHRALGPGLLESAYETCLAYELGQRGLAFERQKPMPINYAGERLETGYRLDLLVEDEVIVELKVAAAIDGVHVAQMMTYLRLSGRRTGLLINFNVPLLRDGIRRFVLNYEGGTPGNTRGRTEKREASMPDQEK